MTGTQNGSLFVEASILLLDEETDEHITRFNASAGATSAPFTLIMSPGIGQELKSLREGIARSVREERFRAFGEKLFRSLFHGDALNLYRACRQQLEEPSRVGRRLVIKINPTTYKLANLPWELLYDPEVKGFLALDARTPVIRFIPGSPQRPMASDSEWRILLVASNPPDIPPDLQHESQQIQAAFNEVAPSLRIEELPAHSPEYFRSILSSFKPHVLHFTGYCNAGRFFLKDPDEDVASVQEENLTVTLQNIPSLRLVFLNACETAAAETERNLGLAHALSRAGIPAVVANQFPLREDAARKMSGELYRALVSGRPVDEAVLQGRITMQGLRDKDDGSTLEWAAPVLYLQSPDGHLFKDFPQRRGAAEVIGKETRPGAPKSPWLEIREERVQSLHRQLKQVRHNLNLLQEQKSKFGVKPLVETINQIEDAEKEIARIEEELADLGVKVTPEPTTPPPEPTVPPEPNLRPETLYQRAEQHFNNKEWDEAIDLLEEVKRTRPVYKETKLMLQEASQKREEIRKQELRQERLRALFKAARALWEEGQKGEKDKWEKALRLLGEILKEDSEFASGEAARLQHEVKRAYDAYCKKQQTERILQTLYEAARLAIEDKNWNRAVNLLQDVEPYKDAADLLKFAKRQALLAELYKQGDKAYQNRTWDEAVEHFSKIQSLAEDYKDVPGKLKIARKQLHCDKLYAQGLAYLKQRDWDNAVEILRQVEPDDDHRQNQPRELAYAQAMQAYTQAAKRAEKRADSPSDWEAVIELLNPIVNETPNNRDAANTLQEARHRASLAKLYEDGRKYIEDKDWAKASRTFEIITRENAEYRDAAEQSQKVRREQLLAELYEKGCRYLEWGNRWDKARDEFQAILNIDPSYLDARQRFEQAEKEIRLADLYSRAMQEYGDNNQGAAIDHLKSIVKEEPNYRGGEAQSFLEKWESVREIHQAYEEGKTHFQNGRWDEAVPAFERIFKIKPEGYLDAAVMLGVARQEKQLKELYTEATNLIHDGQWEKAIAALVEIQKLKADYLDIPDLLKKAKEEQWLETQYQQGRQYQDTGQWGEAAEVLQGIFQRRPDYSDVKERLAEVHRQKQLAEWYEEAQRAFKAQKWAEAVNSLEMIRKQGAGDYKDVEIMYSRAKDSRDLAELYRQATAALKREDLDAAEKALAAALEIDGGGYQDVQVKLAEVRRRKRLQGLDAQARAAFAAGRWEEAIKAYRQVVDIDASEEATQRLQKAEQMKKLADIYAAAEQAMDKEDWSKAIKHYQDVLELDENYRDVKTRLARAEQLRKIHALYQSAVQRESNDDLEGALELHRSILVIDSKFEDSIAKVKALELKRLYRQAMDALKRSRFTEAIPLLQELVKREPGYEGAQAQLQKAIRDHHDILQEMHQYAQTLKRERRFREAREVFEKYEHEMKKSPWFT
jgi:outer membrane protein assembly factor BamD (BamD/ComL family)